MSPGEQEVYEAAKRTFKWSEWIVLPQVCVSTGYNHYAGDRMIDLFVMNTYPSKRFRTLAIEIKHSVSDWNADLRDPAKQLMAHLYSDEFYWCVTEEMLDKIPRAFPYATDGLMVVRQGHLVIHYKARSRQEKIPFGHGFVMALLRRAIKHSTG